MEVFDDEHIDKIDRELAEIQRKLATFDNDDEKVRTLTLLPTTTDKSIRPKINYANNERKYDYDRIDKLKKLDEEVKPVVTPKISKAWLAANMEAPNPRDFYEEDIMYRPSGALERDLVNAHSSVQNQLAKTIEGIRQRDDLTQLNACDTDYAD